MNFKMTFLGLVVFVYVSLVSVDAQELFNSEKKLSYRFSLINESSYNWLNSTPLNKDNKLVPQIRYGNFSGADIFLNRSYFSIAIKGVAAYSDRDQPDYKAVVRELYFDRAIGEFLHLTLGRKIFKWGTGYAFNPSGVIEPAKDAADPSDRLEQYQGRQIINLDAYSAGSSFSLVYANEASYNHKLHWGKHELAVRYYSLVKEVDLSLLTHWKEDDKAQFGFNTAYTYGSHIELHGEFIAQQGTNKLYHQVLDSLNYQIYFDNYPYLAVYQNSHKIFYKLLIGAQYTFNSGLNLMVEYFYNREGLTAKEWDKWRQFILYHQQRTTAIPPDPSSCQNFYQALYTLDRKGSMRHYGFFRLYLPQKKSGLEMMLFSNLVDGSGAGISTFNYYFNSYLTGWIRAEVYLGTSNSELGLLFKKSSVNLGVKISL